MVFDVIRIEKSVYSPPEPADGKRILVMTLWPRGVSKEKVDVWMKELGTERTLIRKWKDGEIGWESFTKEYYKSLRGKENLLKQLAEESKKGTITLLCTDRDEKHCHRSRWHRLIERFELAL